MQLLRHHSLRVFFLTVMRMSEISKVGWQLRKRANDRVSAVTPQLELVSFSKSFAFSRQSRIERN